MIGQLQELRDDTAIVLVDFPGFDGAPVKENWSMEEFAGSLHRRLVGHGIRQAVVAGISMGGYAALEFYRDFPSAVRALVLSNTSASADTEAAKLYRKEFAEDALSRGAVAAMERLYAKFVTDETDPEIAHDIRTWILSARPEAIAAALGAMAARKDSTDLLPLVAVPSLLISGSRDESIPNSVVREMAGKLRSSSYVELEGAAHLTAAERPLEWAEALSSFLDRL
jgi:non-heme chloroperoxidase